jgi:hypothetical protein
MKVAKQEVDTMAVLQVVRPTTWVPFERMSSSRVKVNTEQLYCQDADKPQSTRGQSKQLTQQIWALWQLWRRILGLSAVSVQTVNTVPVIRHP